MRLPFTPALPIRTERLELREFRPDDLDALLVFHADPANVLYVPFEARTPDEMRVALDKKIAGRSLTGAGEHLDLAVTLHDGTVVGDLVVMLHALEHETVEVGWIFDPAHGGRGYATEAVRAMLALVFEGLGARRAVARVDARNTASLQLCARVGMRKEAHLVENEVLKGELTTEVDYALLSREWPGTAADRDASQPA